MGYIGRIKLRYSTNVKYLLMALQESNYFYIIHGRADEKGDYYDIAIYEED